MGKDNNMNYETNEKIILVVDDDITSLKLAQKMVLW